MKYDKRALTLQQMYPAVIAIIIIGIVLGVGAFTLHVMRREIGADTTGTSVANATVGTNATHTLPGSSTTGYLLKEIAVTAANGSSHTWTNYTYTYDGSGVVTFGFDVANNSDFVNISTTYITNTNDAPTESIYNTVLGLGNFADWIAIIVVVIAAAVVLGVVLGSFGRETGV